MKRSLVEEFENDIENALENLDYEIPFDIDSYITTDPYTDSKVGVVEVEFDYDEMDDCVPDSWDEDVEDAIDEAMNEWWRKRSIPTHLERHNPPTIIAKMGLKRA